MPLILSTSPFLDRPVRPLERAGILFQRLQRFISFKPAQDPDSGEMVVILKVQVRHFTTSEEGTAGADASALIPPYFLSYVASNVEAVDVQTQEIVYTRTLETAEEWQALLAADPRPLALRGDAFGRQMHQAQQTAMSEQLVAAMDAADGAPWYRFGGAPEPETSPITSAA